MVVPNFRAAFNKDVYLYPPSSDTDRSGKAFIYYSRMNYSQSSPKTINYYVCFYEGETPDKYKYDYVLGDDDKTKFKCIKSHTSGENNRPTKKYDGSNSGYREFWEEAIITGKRAEEWKENKSYKTNLSLKASVNYFTSNNKVKIEGKEYTKEEIGTLIKSYIDEFNAIGLGINFVYSGQKDVFDIGYIVDVSTWPSYEYNKTGNSSITITSGSGVEAAGVGIGSWQYFGIKAIIYAPELLANDEIIKHEMLHCLGFAHEEYYYESSDKLITWGNPNWSNSLLQVGFIRKNTGWWKSSPYPTEDKVSFLDVLYKNNNSYRKKIYGNVNGTGTIKYTNSDGTEQTITANKLYNGEIHSNAEAFLYDTHKKELQYRAPIDKSGYFEFRIRVVPPSTVGIILLITSEHIARKFIYKRRDSSAESYVVVNEFENGYLYYGNKTIDLSGTDIQVTDITFTDKVESLKELELKLGCYLEYIGGGGDKVKGTNGKQYTCIDSHKSNNNNLPITGLKWRKKWRYEGTLGGSSWINKHDYNSKYKNFQENNQKLKAKNTPSSKTYISEKNELCGL